MVTRDVESLLTETVGHLWLEGLNPQPTRPDFEDSPGTEKLPPPSVRAKGARLRLDRSKGRNRLVLEPGED